ncbi:MAG: hypothetical protein ASARMPREDX12_001727 [Alectoria sarmentosa]|nr:MAG: hypothetical protein ASARMPREDX12_001727 [Alectoria sarmentosa]
MPPGAFDNSCSWPRRLLHIQTLRSYEWQPGNIYGGYRNPGYNALSYTWGRWQLCEDEMPEISAIRVKGTSWSIPRIDPVHFTAEKFAAVIADTADPHPSESNASGVDFLWLDVACIDQSPESREKAQEIGRQAKIFRGATHVFVWLTTHDRFYYNTWASEMEPKFELMCGPKFHTDVDIRCWTMEVTMIVANLLADPWFSSLWTLQETFLSPDAVIIPGDAMKSSIDLCRLGFISETLQTIKDALSYDDKIREADGECGLSAMIDRTGLLVCLDQDSMGLLTAAGNRTTRHEEDRVYGIMQVFEFQLGNSASDIDENRAFSLEELNDQLGAALLEKTPILSQMHIYQGKVEPSKGWRLNKSSIVPPVSKVFYHRKRAQPAVESRATLSCQQSDASLWGRFSGPTISFRVFAQRLLHDWPNAWFYGGATVLLDREILDRCFVDHRATDLSRAAFLAHHTPEVTILLLGLQTEPKREGEKGRRSAVGLLLHRFSDLEMKSTTRLESWKRVGLFIWSIDSERPEEEATRSNEPFKLLAESLRNLKTTIKHLPYLKGEGPEWKDASGLFG